MIWRSFARVIGVVTALAFAASAGAQGRRGAPPAGPARSGTTERVIVDGRDGAVYLPPSYGSDAMRRFPVVYMIGERPFDSLRVPQAADRLAAAPGFSEPIVVLVDAASADGEKFVAEDLVAYMDGRYRTLAARISRGLAGYAAGGSVVLRVGMKRPDVFSSLYLASAMTEGQSSQLDGSAANLQRYYAIAVDVGTKDTALASTRQLHDAMIRLRIPHYYEEYDGGHADKVGERIETRVLPFFSRNLLAPANPTSPAVR